MDFEIEGDDDYDFEDDWKKNKSKKSFFGVDSGVQGEDTYDYDFGDVSSNKNSKIDKYSHVRSSYAPSSSTQPASKLKDVSNVSKSMSAIDKKGGDALANAQNMLSKYSAKPIQKKKVASSMFDFDEDDISVDSDMDSSPMKKPINNKNNNYPISNASKKIISHSMDSMDSAFEESDSAMDIGGGLDSGPPMFGDPEPPSASYQSKSINNYKSNSGPNTIERQSSKASIKNDYEDIVHDDPSPYKMPRGNYNSNPINNFSIDADDASYRCAIIIYKYVYMCIYMYAYARILYIYHYLKYPKELTHIPTNFYNYAFNVSHVIQRRGI